MLDGLSLGIHFVNIDTGDSRILGVVVEQVQEVNVGPHIVTRWTTTRAWERSRVT